MYDYLIVGSGLFGSVCARELNRSGKKVLVLEKRDHIGGNIYTEQREGINVHKYGAHIFHTSDLEIWEYVNSFVEFNNFINSPMAMFKDKIYNLPFNMNTFYQLWGTKTPEDARAVIAKQKSLFGSVEPQNLEEQALSLVGKDIYEKLIKGYTEKQWGRPATEIPAFIIRRLPVRFTYDNNYFTDRYQGIPIGGYTALIEAILAGIKVETNTDYLADQERFNSLAKNVIYTGPIDAFFNHKYGRLEYRSLKFEHEVKDTENWQGNAVVNYTDKSVPYTRILEHKHFEKVTTPKTVITKEYSTPCGEKDEPYYPINDAQNSALLEQYQQEVAAQSKVIFGGRLAEYKYYDMHQVIRSAFDTLEKLGVSR